ncbi:MAG: ankyrin repeat domain-containing protein [bacterium]|nr:ankyrin repeat domain-containing protein [bacterium]
MNTTYTLVEAASTGNERKAEECLRAGVDVNAFAVLWPPSGLTNALMAAVRMGDMRMVSFLIDRGARVNVSVKDGRTPLMIAIEQNNIAMFNLLLRERADIHAVTAGGYSVLDIAYAKARIPMIQVLRDAGARRRKHHWIHSYLDQP